jgi:hypothetical protein
MLYQRDAKKGIIYSETVIHWCNEIIEEMQQPQAHK